MSKSQVLCGDDVMYLFLADLAIQGATHFPPLHGGHCNGFHQPAGLEVSQRVRKSLLFFFAILDSFHDWERAEGRVRDDACVQNDASGDRQRNSTSHPSFESPGAVRTSPKEVGGFEFVAWCLA